MWFTASWVHIRSADCLLSIPAGYTSVQQTGIVDAVEERSQVRFRGSITGSSSMIRNDQQQQHHRRQQQQQQQQQQDVLT